MTDLETFESLCPDVAPLSPRDRAVMRRELFGNESHAGPSPVASADASLELRGDPTHRLRTEPPRRARGRTWLNAAAAALLVLGVAAVWATASNRDAGDPAPAQEPPATRGTDPDASQPSIDSAGPAVPVAQAGERALVLDPIPDGWSLTHLSTRRGITGSSMSTQVFATASLLPETAPAFVVDVIDVDAGRPDIPAGAEPVTVQGVPGSLYEDSPGLVVSYESSGTWVTITGHQVDRDALLMAAEYTRLEGTDAVIDPAGLPAGVAKRATGGRIEAWFINDAATVEAGPEMRWESDTGESMWLLSMPGTAQGAALGRIGAASVSDVDVNGNPGFITTIADDDQYRSLTWTADGDVHLLGSRGLDHDRLLEYASAMRTPTDTEWDAAVAAATPTMATLPDDGGLPEPGSVVPYRVTVFPMIDETLVPDEGRGATYAFATYGLAGIEIDGSHWIGTVGPADWDVPSDLVNVAVANDGLLEPTLGEPVRDPDIVESRGESSIELRSTVDGIVVRVIGADTDVLYEVIEAIRPIIVDGRLDGYVAEELPPGLTDLTGPIGTGWPAGAIPIVNVHNALTMQVRPAAAITAIEAGAHTERVDIAGRPGYLYTSPDSPYQMLNIEIDEHTTLTLNSGDLSRDQLLNIAAQVELVDQSTWNATYNPLPAVIPTIVDYTTSTTPND